MEYMVGLTIETERPLTDAVIEDVASIGGAAGGTAGQRRLLTTLSVRADSAAAAIESASALVLGRAPGLVVAAEVATVEEADQRAQHREEYVGVAEIAEMLGISRQRITEMHRDRKDFPMPVAALKSGPVWRKADLSRFADGWQRRPGRPRKAVEPPDNHVEP